MKVAEISPSLFATIGLNEIDNFGAAPLMSAIIVLSYSCSNSFSYH